MATESAPVPYLLLFRNSGPETHAHLSSDDRSQLNARGDEAIGGYVVLMVNGLDEATAIAQQHPGLKYGLEIEVRQMAAHCHLGITPKSPPPSTLAAR